MIVVWPAWEVARPTEDINQGRLVIADSYLDDDWMRTLTAAAGRPQPTRIVHVDAVADRPEALSAETDYGRADGIEAAAKSAGLLK